MNLKTFKLLRSTLLILRLGFVGSIGLGVILTTSAQTQPPCTVILVPVQPIQGAIKSASSGDIICLWEGVWRENLEIEKSLTLRGSGWKKTTLKGYWGNTPVILIRSDVSRIEIKIEDLTITEGELGGIWLQGGPKAIISNSQIFRNNFHGIVIENFSEVTISNSKISENTYSGIILSHSSQATISNSEISDHLSWSPGILISDSSQATISNSLITHNGGNGITMAGSSQATISKTLITNHRGDGIFINDSSQVTISNSWILDNKDNGIYIHGWSQANISNSSILKNEHNGISIGGQSRVNISNSSILKNRDGIIISGSSQAIINNTSILANVGYGVALMFKDCGYSKDDFGGRVEGDENMIYFNGKGDLCPPPGQYPWPSGFGGT